MKKLVHAQGREGLGYLVDLILALTLGVAAGIALSVH